MLQLEESTYYEHVEGHDLHQPVGAEGEGRLAYQEPELVQEAGLGHAEVTGVDLGVELANKVQKGVREPLTRNGYEWMLINC